MEQAVLIQQDERVLPKDFNNFGQFPRDAIDHLLKDIAIPDQAFIGFTVTGTVGSPLLTVGAGRLYYANQAGTPVYFNSDEGGVRINLAADLPVVTQKWFLVYVYPNQTTSGGEARTFLTDAQTRDTVGKQTATISLRRAEIRAIGGEEGPDPQKPAVPSTAVVVARVLCDSQGVLTIERADENIAPNIRDLDTARKENLSWRSRTGTRLDTLGSDISALAASVKGLASDTFVREIAGDVALLKTNALIPASYTSYDANNFLDTTKTETNHVDNLCQIKEGIRFSPANNSDSQLGLLNSIDPKVKVNTGFVLPAYTEIPRVQIQAPDGELSCSQYTFVNQTIVQKTKPVTRVQYGTPFSVCSNDMNFWNGSFRDFANNTVIKDGITYQIVNVNPIGDFPNHDIWRLQQVWTELYNEPYWDVITTTDTANGSQISQSILNTQDGWLTSVDINFTRVAAAGDVIILVTETTNAAPDVAKTLTKQVLPVGQMRPGVNRVQITPTMLMKGSRYGIFIITAGNHFVGITKGNKYAGGSKFVNTDGAFQVGDLLEDICIGLNFAKFSAPYVEVDLLPLQLAGGIAAIDIWANAVQTPGTKLVWYILDPANNQWKALDATTTGGGTALVGLPPLVKMKVALIGTVDMMPGFDTSYQARARCWRPRSDGRHISAVRTLPAACKNITLKVRLEAWRTGGAHTYVPRILTGPLLNTGSGDTTTNFTTMSEVPAPDDPTYAIIRTYTFVLATAVTSFRIREEFTTNNVLTTQHVAQRIDICTP